MTATAETLESIRRRHAEELAKAERNFAMQSAVTEALGLTADNWSAGFMHAYGADCAIRYTAPDLASAICIAERMGPVHLVKVKDSSTSFLPLSRVPEKRAERAEVVTVCPYIYEVDGIAGQPEEKTLRFYVEAAGYVVRVDVRVEVDPLTYRRHTPARRDNRGRVIEPARWDIVNRSGYFCSVICWWTSPGQPNKFTLYSL